MSATDQGAPEAGVVDPGSGARSDSFSQNLDTPAAPPTGTPDVSPVNFPAWELSLPPGEEVGVDSRSGDVLIERCAQLVVRTRRMLLSALQARSLYAEDAQWLVERLVVGLAAADDVNLAGWLATVARTEARASSPAPLLGSPSGDPLRHTTYLQAPTGAELEELEVRLTALARQLPRPHP